MAFSLSPDDSKENVVDAVNYLLSNFKGTVSANNSNGQVTGPTNTVLSYLYKYLAVKYADSFDGQTNFSNSPTNRLYYGLRNTDSSVESTNYQDYVWYQVTGGFGTTKFFYYSVTGGRSIVIQIATSLPSSSYAQESGPSIDLDALTVIPSGVVTSVTGSGNIASSGGSTPNITFTGVLPIANGGTNSIATPTAGAVIYSTGTAYGATAAGVTGQFLTSSGTGVPIWTNSTAFAGAIGYYGAFQDSSTVTATSSTVAYVMNIGAVDLQNGVSIVSGNQITVANAGIYNLQFSAQFSNPNAAIADISVWFRINGVDVTNGAGTNGVPAKHGSNNGLQIVGWNSIFSLNAGDYVQLVWHSDATGVQLITIPATTGPAVPESPSLIVTIAAQSQIGIGYYGETSTTSVTIGTGSKTLTVSIPATSTAFTTGTRVRVAYATTPANFMEGVITSFTGTTMVVNVDLTGGSGTFALWTVSIAGNQGTGAVTSVSGTTGRITSTGGTTPVIDLASGIATAGTTGSTTLIPVVTIDTYGRVTSITTAANPQGTVTSVTGTAPVVSSGGSTPAISMAAATASVNGYLTSADWTTFNNKSNTTGTVTSVSVTSANGFTGTVATATTTPAITLTTSITGLLKGNGTAISAAVANTDYVPLSTVLTVTADYTIVNTDTWIINNKTGSALVLTFPAASSWTGRSITVKNMQTQLVNSVSSNIVPIGSTTASTAILLGVIGNWAHLVSDGTNWVIMQAAANNNLLLE